MPRLPDDIVELEMEIDRLRWESAHDRAKELVFDRGWTEKDEDFLFQVEDETRRQWEEDLDKEMERQMWDPSMYL